jgi:tellurite resistance protein TerA
VSLTKSTSGVLKVNLQWNARPAGKGFLKRFAGVAPIDLDLGCLWELANGSKGVVQALGNGFTAPSGAAKPVLWLDKDDRSGNSAEGENLFVDLSQVDQLRRVLVFAYIYDGAARFDEAAAVVTLTPAQGPPIEVRLDEQAGTAPMCAIAVLENAGGQLSVRREVRFLEGKQSALDEAYGWGLQWRGARKD